MTISNRIHRNTEGEGEAVVTRLGRGVYRIASFSEPNTFYEVDPYEGTCTCPRYEYTNSCTKHVTLADAVCEARKLKFGSRIAEDRVTELCFRLFAPLKKECCIVSSNLRNEVNGCRYSTPRMKKAAAERHRRVLLAHDCGRGRAA